MHFIKSIGQGLALLTYEVRLCKILPSVRTFCFDHFTVKNKIDTRTKTTAIRRQTMCKESLTQNMHYSKKV